MFSKHYHPKYRKCYFCTCQLSQNICAPEKAIFRFYPCCAMHIRAADCVIHVTSDVIYDKKHVVQASIEMWHQILYSGPIVFNLSFTHSSVRNNLLNCHPRNKYYIHLQQLMNWLLRKYFILRFWKCNNTLLIRLGCLSNGNGV